MKVQVQIKQTVEYMAHVEMTKAEFDDWESQLKSAGMYGDNDIAEAIIEKYGHDVGMRLGEPNDWGQLTVDTFNPIKGKRSAAQRSGGEK